MLNDILGRACFLPLVLLFGLVSLTPAQAQEVRRPLFDAVTFGVGVNALHGDIDQNPDNSLIKYLGRANMNLLLNAERSMGHFVLGIGTQYHRFTARNAQVDMANNLLSFDVTASYGFNIIRPGFLRLYAGIGPMLALPEYYRFPKDGRAGYEKAGTRFVLSVPVGLVIQDRVRLGLRITNTDFLEGVEGNGGRDMISFINLGYRFWL